MADAGRDGTAKHRIGGDGLADVTLSRTDAQAVVRHLMDGVRAVTWLERPGPEDALRAHRATRMCYELLDSMGAGGDGRLTGLSREDADILYAVPLGRDTEPLNRALNEFRLLVRPAGPVGPVEADRMAKGLVDMMEG